MENTQAFGDLLEDLTTRELAELMIHCWGGPMNRRTIKLWRKSVGKDRYCLCNHCEPLTNKQ
jgi:hypothetical protein